jgi:hypothetical protein
LKVKLEEIFPGDGIEEQELIRKGKNNASPSAILLYFFSAQLPWLSTFLLSANHVFIASFLREQLALWKERKEPHHPLTRKEITADHRIKIKYSSFLFLLTRDYTLELM